jgi:hypothetical protein
MMPKECHLTKFTQCNLQHSTNWTDWDAAFNAQLDAHCQAGAIGHPIPLDKPAPHCAHMNGGSMATTCDQLDYLWHVFWYTPWGTIDHYHAYVLLAPFILVYHLDSGRVSLHTSVVLVYNCL